MDSGSTVNQIIQKLLEDKSLPNLIPHQAGQIFPLSNTIPDDLKNNLISQSRVIRNINNNGQDASIIIRAFYFQLLKLCYQLQDEQKSHSYLQITKSILFHQSILKNAQLRVYAKQIAQFMRMIESEQDLYFQNILQEYNQIDNALVNMLGSLVGNYQEVQSCQNPIQNILNELCSYFSVVMVPNHPFYQFVETDIYLYVCSLEQMYLVYDELYYSQSKNNVNQPINQPNLQKNLISQVQNQYTGNIYGIEDEQSVKNSQHISNRPVPSQLQSINKYNQQINIPIQLSQKQSIHPQGSSQDGLKDYKQYYKSQNPFNKRQFQNNGIYSSVLRQSTTENNSFNKRYTFQLTSNKGKTTQIKQQYPQYPLLHNNGIAPTSDARNQQAENISQLNQGESSANTPYNSMYSSNGKNETLMNLFGDMAKQGKNSVGQQYDVYTKRQIFNNHGQIKQTNRHPQREDKDKQRENAQQNIQMKRQNNTNSVDITEQKIISNQVAIQQQNINIYTKNLNMKYNSIQSKNKMLNNHILHQKPNEIYDKGYNDYKKTHQTSIENKNKKQSTVNFDQDDSIFYKPRSSQMKVIPEAVSSKETINNRKHIQNNDSKGSIYRQFSDTRILNLLKQPHKTKVQIMRSRFKGYHFN